LVAVLLGTGGPQGTSALGLAHSVVAGLTEGASGLAGAADGTMPAAQGDNDAGRRTALSRLATMTVAELQGLPGVGLAKAARLVAGVELGRRVCEGRNEREAVKSPSDVYRFFGQRLRHLDREHFMAVLLDTKNRILATELISIGSLDSSLVHPRELFKAAVRHSASAVILVHNHPSGDPAPSSADLACTKRLAEAGRLLGIEVLDHVIIGDGQYVSFRERGIGALSAGVQ
jgi:DNA repair protein RadC